MQLFDRNPANRLLAEHEDLVYPFVFDFFRLHLSVSRGTFCPTLTNTTPFFVQHLIEQINDGPIVEVFAGAGAIGLQFAKVGIQTTFIEQSGSACSSLLANAQSNHCVDQVSVVHSSIGVRPLGLAEGVYRHAIANPPLLPGLPRNSLEASIFDPQYSGTLAFLDLLPSLLTEDGRGWILLSDVFERYGLSIDSIAMARGFEVCDATSKDVGYETYTVFELRRIS